MSYRGASQPAAPRTSMTVGYRNTTSGSTYGRFGGSISSTGSSPTAAGVTSHHSHHQSSGADTGGGMFSTLSSGPTFERGHNTTLMSRSSYNNSSYGNDSAGGGGGGSGLSATERLMRAADSSSQNAHSRYGTSSSSLSTTAAGSAVDRNPLHHHSSALSSMAPPPSRYGGGAPSTSIRPPSASASYRPRNTMTTELSSNRFLSGAAGSGSSYSPSSSSSPQQYNSRRPASIYDEDDSDEDGPPVTLAKSGSLTAKSVSSSGNYNTSSPSTTLPPRAAPTMSSSPSSPSAVINKSSVARSPPVGLRNIGNTCYMNASLQCLIHASGNFIPALERERSKLARALANLGRASNITDLMACKGAAAHLNHEFHGGRQNDAHEFIREFVHAVHIEVNRVGKGAYKEMKDIDGESDSDAGKRWFAYFRSHDDSIVTDYFGGFMRAATVCGSCSHRSLSFSPVWDLSLSMTPGRNSVPEMIRDFMKVEALGSDSSFHCEKCKKKRSGKRQSLLVNWPRVLVLHLCRFTYSGARNSHAVDFPTRLDADVIPMPNSGTVESSADPSVGYSLSGVVLHRGTASFGHYTAMVRPLGSRSWYNCDDSMVREVSESEVLRQRTEAYVLFYTLDC